MPFRTLTRFLVCFLTVGCASWFQQDGAEPVPYTPSQWYQQADSPLVGAAIEAGYSEADITPFRDQWLAGYGVGRKSKAVVHPLRAQCLALKDQNNEKIMIVAMDLLGVLPDFIDGVLSQVTGWPHDRILFSCSHTHSAPDTYGIYGDGLIVIPFIDGKDPEYLQRIQEDIAAAIESAAVNMVPAAVRFASGTAPDCIARKEPGITPDPTIALLQVAIGHNVITLCNFALHPDLNKGGYVTPDFVYFLRQLFEAQTNGRMMFVNGANGAVQPITKPLDCNSNYQNQGRWVRAREIGEELARETIMILQNPIVPGNADIHVEKAFLELTVGNWFFKTFVNWKLLPGLTDSGNDWKVRASVHFVEIGPAQILTAPGELFPERWEYIKPKLTGQPKFIFGLTHIGLGYIMSKEDFESGDFPYHAGQANIGDPMFGEKLVQTYEQLIGP